MVRPKDPFWKHAKNLKNGRFSCNFCHGQFAGGISRIKWHLSGLKSHDIKVCEQVPRDILLAVRQVLDTPNKKDGRVEDENYSVPSSSGGRNLCMKNDSVMMGQNDNNNLLELNRAPNSGNEKDKRQLLDKQLAEWLFLFGICPAAIDSRIFKDFVKSIGEYGPSYQLPSADSLERELMLDVEKEAKEYVENFINDQVQAVCTLMVSRRCMYQGGFIYRGVIFAYSQGGVACLNSFNYEPESERIPDVIYSTIELLGPNRVIQILISDHFGDWDLSREFKNRHPRIHACQSVAAEIDAFLNKLEWDLPSTIFPVDFIFYAYHYYKMSSIGEMKIPMGLFAFALFKLKTILKFEDELRDVSFSSIMGSSEVVKVLDDEQKKAHYICAKLLDYIIGCEEFWDGVRVVTQLWVLLFQTRCLAKIEDLSIGYLYQIIERLRDAIEKGREHDRIIKDCIWENFSKLRGKIIHPIHAAAAFLDPAYMYTDNFEVNAEMMDGTNYMFENMVDQDEKEAFTKELQQYRMKLPELFTAQAITMLKTCHPRIWWDFCGKHAVPVLRKYAIQILSQPCSISFCERYQNQVRPGDLRSRDWLTRVNVMIKNEKFKSLQLEPIILDKLGEDFGEGFNTFEYGTDEEFKRRFEFKYLLHLTDKTLVDVVINDWSPFWDNVEKNWRILGYPIY